MRFQQPIDGMNSRVVLGVYAAVTWPVGIYFALWGSSWFGTDLNGLPYGLSALVRVAGTLILLAACCATGLAAIDSPRDRRLALGWFALGHAIVFVMLLLQRIAISRVGLSDWVLRMGFMVTAGLVYAWGTAEGDPTWRRFPLVGLLRLGGGGSTRDLRSRYEEQIREAAAQEERNRLARDLHDSIKQQIFVIHTAAATAQTRLESDAAGTADALAQIRGSAREAMAEMEAMTDRLRAAPLVTAGLVEALKRQCEATGFTTGAVVEFTLGRLPADDLLAPGAQQAIFRAAQEALANVARHARATHVHVTLDSTAAEMYVRIVDDGSGYDQEAKSNGMGLANMRARAAEFSGDFAITSRPGHGTDVRFAVPYTAVSAWDYKRKALWAAAIMAIVLTLIVTERQIQGAWSRTTVGWFVLVMGSLDLVRYLTAWRRATRIKAGVS